MVGTKVICIDASYPTDRGLKDMEPLEEFRVYVVRDVLKYPRGYGYLLEGVFNYVSSLTNKEAGYSVRRFIPLSEKEETVLEEQHATN